jgi:N-acetylornithine carbamoyltransferase
MADRVRLGTVMDGDTEEHIAEVARVLGRYVDLIGRARLPEVRGLAARTGEDIVLKSSPGIRRCR